LNFQVFAFFINIRIFALKLTMQHATIPKFSKVEIFEVSQNFVSSNVFENCGLMITGGYLIVTTEESENETTRSITTGRIFKLDNLKGYKTYSK